jgi:hypothetical protein
MKKQTMEQIPRPPVVMKSGQRMCINPKCRRVFTPDVFGQMHCTPTCEHAAPVRKTARADKRAWKHPGVKLLPTMIVLLLMLGSCHSYMTNRSIKQSLEIFQTGIDSLHRENKRIADNQHQLFMRYRTIYKRMTGIDTNGTMTAADSMSVRLQLLMATVSLDAIVQSMKTESVIYDDVHDRITDLVIAMDELTYQAENAYRNDADGMPIPFKKAWPVLYAVVCNYFYIIFVF